MKKYKELMITTIVCLIPMAIGAYFYDQLPAQVPVHWLSLIHICGDYRKGNPGGYPSGKAAF